MTQKGFLISLKRLQFWIWDQLQCQPLVGGKALNILCYTQQCLNLPSFFLSVFPPFTYPASRQTLWRWPGCHGPGPAGWRYGWPPCRCAGSSRRATAPAARTGSWTGAGPAGPAALCRSDRSHHNSTLPPPQLLQCYCHPSTDWWSAPSGGGRRWR